MTTNVALSGTPAGRGSLLFESEPIYVVSFYLITRHNLLIITEGWLSPTGHQPNISWSLGLLLLLINYYYYYCCCYYYHYYYSSSL